MGRVGRTDGEGALHGKCATSGRELLLLRFPRGVVYDTVQMEMLYTFNVRSTCLFSVRRR